MHRYGVTIPFDRIALADQADLVREIGDLGYTDVWSSEVNGADAFTPLVLAATWAPSLHLGTAIVPAYTRGPACLAQSAASLSSAAPGRFQLGIGSSSDVIVSGWNGIRFDEPYLQVRAVVRFLRAAFTGEKVDGDFGRFAVSGFRLGVVMPGGPPPVLVAALREQMLRLAGREGDGAIINWLSADDVATVAPIVREAAPGGEHREIVARIFVAPGVDRPTVLAKGRQAIAAYLNVGVYAAFHRWLGRDQLGDMWRLWAEGDRAGAVAAIPESVVDELIISGSPGRCREKIERYVANGVTVPVLAVLPFGNDVAQTIRDLAPRR